MGGHWLVGTYIAIGNCKNCNNPLHWEPLAAYDVICTWTHSIVYIPDGDAVLDCSLTTWRIHSAYLYAPRQ